MSSDRLRNATGATFDIAVTAALRLRGLAGGGARTDKLGHAQRLEALAQVRDVYGAPRLWAEPDAFFTPPAPLAPRLEMVREGRGVSVVDASWPSNFEPYLEPFRAKYLAHENNRTAYARLFLAPRPRPAVVLIHGYLAGQWGIEERAWPLGWLSHLGFDAAIVLLPFHALRARTDRRAPPPFPGADPRFTIEGFRQAMLDVRGLVRWLRARGAPSVGVMGMSLGGYTTSLLATVEKNLAFAVPIIPLASVADFARDQGRLGASHEAPEQHRALDSATQIVSPFARPSLLPGERVLVLAAEGDRITPIAHAERLARHFDAKLVRFAGGHLLQFGRRDAFRELRTWLRGIGAASR
jgi:pimeloyl-ACP methyl ester carboxylesterase